MDTLLQIKKPRKLEERHLSNAELSAFCAQMALILGAGLSTLEGVSVMLEDASSPREQQLLSKIYDSLLSSGELSHALEETGCYPGYMCTMVHLGEETGTLDAVLRQLSEHYDREEAISDSIRSAVTYPMVMAVMMIAVIVVLLVKVMPIFNRVFIQLGTQMAGVPKLLMDLGTAISRYSVVLAVLLAVLAAGLFWCGKTQTGARFARKWIQRLGIATPLRSQTALCRLAGGLSLALASGMSQERSLELASALVDVPELAARLQNCKARMESGEDLIKAFQDEGIFSGVYGRLAAIGSRTGSLEQSMKRIADLCQEDIHRRLRNMLAVLEPALVIALSLIVGCILLSVMLPLLGIMSGM